ncbi:PREDICTED: putative F-box/LRR-repeat protein At5g15620 [Erythranthe guttata]|uniref:putative F-box/LRR-repeat protein At5g15620 n=1 Tax=Erythranthe guttata TaxID=4155 RepID=UPI00064DAB65|nr:PREDICTED: putative F-box/LRR-repeat protein At5g15620 [Erythranthe guttata]|eukprot:XP_012832860.1 PREDICTED: putative F-box/LRR-repeat protein At5g15620 [Erythranthe guttata]
MSTSKHISSVSELIDFGWGKNNHFPEIHSPYEYAGSTRYRKPDTHSTDRLSELPDSVLTHILSVRTSILGQRWRGFCCFIKCTTSTLFNEFQIETWITFAIDRNVRSIDLHCSELDARMPRCLFNCRTLVELRLEFCVITDAYEFLTYLLSGSPVIEELVFQSTNDFDSFKISSPTLKRLTLGLAIFRSDDLDCMLESDTPALVYLRSVDLSAGRIKSVELTSLVEANIHIFNNIKPQDSFIYSRLLVELIDRLRNVKCLKLVLTHSTEVCVKSIYQLIVYID